jgi:hypothetical protein
MFGTIAVATDKTRYTYHMKYKYLQILLITAIGAYFIGATDVNDLFVIPFAAVLLFVLVNTSRRGKK